MHEARQTAAAQQPAIAAAAAPITSLKGYWAAVLPLIVLGSQFVIGLIVGIIGAATGTRPGSSTLFDLIAIGALSAGGALLIVNILLSRRGWRWADLGLSESPNLPIALAVAIGLVTCVLAAAFQRAVQGDASPFQNLSPLEFAVAGLVIGVLLPFAEEVVFRGIVFPVLHARLGNAAGAVVLSALIFGVFHVYPLQILVGFALGLPLAWLRHWSGSLLAPIALHMTHNTGVVALSASRIV